LWWDFLPEEQRRAMFEATAASTPAGRVGRPDDVAGAVLFMAGHEFLTGTVLAIAGGAHLPTGR
jgi:NAD(P)-dependent dehydrogenase (short-subunit alcohol dehydrogenase family)